MRFRYVFSCRLIGAILLTAGLGSPTLLPDAAYALSPERTFLVFFDRESDALSERALALIREAAARARTGQWEHLCALGHADRSVPTQRAIELSAARARAVRDELVRDGLTPDDISVTWVGSARPLVPAADGVSEPQNRRVEISHCRAPLDPLKEQEVDRAMLPPMLMSYQAIVSAASGCSPEPAGRWEVVFVCSPAADARPLTLAVQRIAGSRTTQVLLRWDSDGVGSGQAQAEAAARALLVRMTSNPDPVVEAFLAQPMQSVPAYWLEARSHLYAEVTGDAAASRHLLTVTPMGH
jgi:hypothetical protein